MRKNLSFIASVFIFLGLLNFYLALNDTKPLEINETSKVPELANSVILTSPTPIPEKYFLHKDITATLFWVGEEPSPDNNFISNEASFWDKNWVKSFGGVDTPQTRNDWYPAGFIPSENPFYIALPYVDFEERTRKENAKNIPWYKADVPKNMSLVKNRWVKLYHKEKICFAQWEDVGPYLTDDVTYVFGTARPENSFGMGAGIDISPAVRDCLGARSVSNIDWRFVDDERVPEGPWKLITTKSNPRW